MPDLLKNKALVIIGIAVAAYLGIGFFLAPVLLKPRLERFFGERFGRELHIEHVRVNPLTLSFELLGNEVPPGENLASIWSIRVPRASARLRFRKFKPVIPEFLLRQPEFTIKSSDGSISELVDWMRAAQLSRTTPGAGSSFAVDQVRLEKGEISVITDLTDSSGPQHLLWKDLHLQADMRAEPGKTGFELGMISARGAALQATGVIDWGDLSVKGEFQLGQIQPDDALAWAGYPQPVKEQAFGKLQGNFELFPGEDGIELQLANGQFETGPYSICRADAQCTWLYPVDADIRASIFWNRTGSVLNSASIRFDPFTLATGSAPQQAEFQVAASGADLELSSLGPMAKTPGKFSLQVGVAAGGEILANGWLSPAENRAEASLTLTAIGLAGMTWPTGNGSTGNSGQAENQPDSMGTLQAGAILRFDSGGLYGQARFSLADSPFDSTGVVRLKWAPVSGEGGDASSLLLRLNNPGAGLAEPFFNHRMNGRLKAEAMDIDLDYQFNGKQWTGQNSISLSGFELLPPGETEQADSVSPDWVIALLQEPDGSVYMSLPVEHASDHFFWGISEMVENSVLDYLDEIVAAPFEALAALTGYPMQELSSISFAPGSAAVETTASDRLAKLGAALELRPRLALRAAPVFDPVMDRQALQVQQLRTHIALATASGLDFQAGNRPPDFTNLVVHSVIDEFATQRMPGPVLEEFRSHFGHASADEGITPEGNPEVYYEKLFEVLVEYAVIPESAMTTLARYRSQAVIDTLTKQGIDRDRLLTSSTALVSESRFDGIPLWLVLELPSLSMPGQANEE